MEKLTKIIVGYPHGAEGISKDKLTGNYCRGELRLQLVLKNWQNMRN